MALAVENLVLVLNQEFINSSDNLKYMDRKIIDRLLEELTEDLARVYLTGREALKSSGELVYIEKELRKKGFKGDIIVQTRGLYWTTILWRNLWRLTLNMNWTLGAWRM